MQFTHTHIPETNHVPRGYTVTAILSLLFMVPLFLVPALVLSFFYVSTFRSMCAVPNMAVFCSSLTSWFPGMSLTYFLNYLEMAPVAPIITGITLVFTFHMRCISIVRSLYFKIFSVYYYYYYYYYLWRRREVYTGFRWGNLSVRYHLEEPGVDGRIILKWIFRKCDVGAWNGSSWLGKRTGGGH